MSLTKRALSEEAMDALELVGESMTEQEWLEEYTPMYVDPVEKIGDVAGAENEV